MPGGTIYGVNLYQAKINEATILVLLTCLNRWLRALAKSRMMEHGTAESMAPTNPVGDFKESR